MQRDSFIFYRSFYEAIKDLPAKTVKQLFNAIGAKALNNEDIELDGLAAKFMLLIKPQLEANNQKHNKYLQDTEYGKQGGAPVGNQNAKKKTTDCFLDDKNKTTEKQPIKTTPCFENAENKTTPCFKKTTINDECRMKMNNENENDSSCPVSSQSEAQDTQTEQIFVSIPIQRTTKDDTQLEFPVYERQVLEWIELFPAIDVRQELRAIYAWSVANQANRKTLQGAMKFITSWLIRAQNKGGSGYARGQPTPMQVAQSRTEQHFQKMYSAQDKPQVITDADIENLKNIFGEKNE